MDLVYLPARPVEMQMVDQENYFPGLGFLKGNMYVSIAGDLKVCRHLALHIPLLPLRLLPP